MNEARIYGGIVSIPNRVLGFLCAKDPVSRILATFTMFQSLIGFWGFCAYYSLGVDMELSKYRFNP